jgi:hypothetical protein
MASSIRIGVQIDSIDPYWVEVRETIWRICQPSHRASMLHLYARADELATLADAYIELVDIGFGSSQRIESSAATLEEILARELDAYAYLHCGRHHGADADLVGDLL